MAGMVERFTSGHWNGAEPRWRKLAKQGPSSTCRWMLVPATHRRSWLVACNRDLPSCRAITLKERSQNEAAGRGVNPPGDRFVPSKALPPAVMIGTRSLWEWTSNAATDYGSGTSSERLRLPLPAIFGYSHRPPQIETVRFCTTPNFHSCGRFHKILSHYNTVGVYLRRVFHVFLIPTAAMSAPNTKLSLTIRQ